MNYIPNFEEREEEVVLPLSQRMRLSIAEKIVYRHIYIEKTTPRNLNVIAFKQIRAVDMSGRRDCGRPISMNERSKWY